MAGAVGSMVLFLFVGGKGAFSCHLHRSMCGNLYPGWKDWRDFGSQRLHECLNPGGQPSLVLPQAVRFQVQQGHAIPGQCGLEPGQVCLGQIAEFEGAGQERPGRVQVWMA